MPGTSIQPTCTLDFSHILDGLNDAESEARRSALFSLVSHTAPAHSRYYRKVLTLRLGLPFSEARNLARQMCCLTKKVVRAPMA